MGLFTLTNTSVTKCKIPRITTAFSYSLGQYQSITQGAEWRRELSPNSGLQAVMHRAPSVMHREDLAQAYFPRFRPSTPPSRFLTCRAPGGDARGPEGRRHGQGEGGEAGQLIKERDARGWEVKSKHSLLVAPSSRPPRSTRDFHFLSTPGTSLSTRGERALHSRARSHADCPVCAKGEM